nr:MAG TPA: hypothetical protein [Caudoviricetes sp.]
MAFALQIGDFVEMIKNSFCITCGKGQILTFLIKYRLLNILREKNENYMLWLACERNCTTHQSINMKRGDTYEIHAENARGVLQP